MKPQDNFNQPIGVPVPGWKGARPPRPTSLVGRCCTVEPLDAKKHLDSLWKAQRLDPEGRSWTYLSYGPYTQKEAYAEMLASQASSQEPLFFAIVDNENGGATGVASYLRILPRHGSVEIGHIYFAPSLQRKTAATEALFLLIDHAFMELGNRRVEWKCDSLNQASRAAANRLGFTFEGVFRQATVYKGRNRDTAWYSILDTEWAQLRTAFQRWLSKENFEESGQQRARLSELTAEALKMAST